MKNICVFTGSNRGTERAYVNIARTLGAEMARRGIGLVYGASKMGLMGVVADAALAAGARVVGIVPEALVRKELLHEGLSATEIVESMHQRKARFSELSDGFIAMPGGLGTLEEYFEVLTWAQLGFHAKPVGILNAGGYYDELLQFLDKAVTHGFVHAEHRGMMLIENDPARLLDAMQSYVPPMVSKWIDRADEL